MRWLLLARFFARLILLRLRETICGVEDPELRLMQVSIEGLAVFFTVLQFFCVEKTRWLFSRHVVGGPLSRVKFEERVPKAISVVSAGDGKLEGMQRGRAVRRKSKTFDSTKGFPGEDVAT